jgi:ATP/maltotriose-dependent transcriptional regulator MalT
LGGSLVDSPDIFLSARETQALLLIAQGKSNQEIAEELVLAVNTVKRPPTISMPSST